MIARLPEMHKHLRELAAQVALLTTVAPPAEAGDDPTGF